MGLVFILIFHQIKLICDQASSMQTTQTLTWQPKLLFSMVKSYCAHNWKHSTEESRVKLFFCWVREKSNQIRSSNISAGRKKTGVVAAHAEPRYECKWTQQRKHSLVSMWANHNLAQLRWFLDGLLPPLSTCEVSSLIHPNNHFL